MNILLLNWRDRTHPRAGGAEVRLHRVYAPLVEAGHRVVLYCCGWPGCKPHEIIDGIEVHRLGSDWNFSLLCMLRLRRWIKQNRADIVVEDFNKLPFLSPWISSRPVVIQMHHLWRGSIFREAAFPVALFIWLNEQLLRVVYRRSRFCVVSDSTSVELQQMGISPEQITIIHNGIDRQFYTPSSDVAEPAQPPYLFWLGRLQRYKGILDALHAFASLKEKHPDLQLKIAGSGPFRIRAEVEAERLGLEKNIEFLGYVSQSEKRRLLRGALVVLQTSWKEGWGLTVIEANACGRMVVAADSPGLRDSVRDGETGLLYRCGDSQSLSEMLQRILSDQPLRVRMEQSALEWADLFGWSSASAATEQLLLDHLQLKSKGVRR